jgi:hypothetical protein
MEAVFRVLAANSRGVLVCLDELGSLILGLNQYRGGRGNDRPNLLKTWSGAPVTIDRVGNEMQEPIRIPHPQLAIMGNLPPARLAEMERKRGDDGFMDRWLFIYPDRRPKPSRAERSVVSDQTLAGWMHLARWLWQRPMERRGTRQSPRSVGFSHQGLGEFDRHYDRHVAEVNDRLFPDDLRGAWSKLEVYAGRLALVLHVLHEENGRSGHRLELNSETARDAWRLVDYFKSHARRVRAWQKDPRTFGMPHGAKLILNWLANHPEADAVSARGLTLVPVRQPRPR